MSIRVTDPAGVDWTVSREWFGLPEWARRDDPADLGGLPDVVPLGGDVDDGIGVLGVLAALAVVAVVLLVLVLVVAPLFVLLLGVLVALAGLALRLASVTAWTVQAESDAQTLFWRVRGFWRSRRAMQGIATRLARGEGPEVDGVEGGAAPTG